MIGVAVTIPNFNGAAFIGATIDALLAGDVVPDEVVVVDNGSTDGSVAMLRDRHPTVRIEALADNLGFAGGANHGVRSTSAPLVAVLNSDAIVDRRWLAELLAAPRPDDVWAWGSVLVSEETGLVESAGDVVSRHGLASKHLSGRSVDDLPAEPYEVFAPPGASPLFRRDVFDELGGYVDRFFMYYEDVDLSFRARLLGYRALMVPSARVRHKLGASGVKARSRYFIARNSTWCALRNLPDATPRLLVAAARRELRDARRRGYVVPFARGKAAAVVGIPRVLRERQRIQSSRRISEADVRSLFT